MGVGVGVGIELRTIWKGVSRVLRPGMVLLVEGDGLDDG